MAKFKKPFLFALCLLPIALVAGAFALLYQLDVYPEEILAEALEVLGSTTPLIIIGAVQTAVYALICGFFGYLLADAIGLWRPFKWEKKSLTVTLAASFVGGILFSLDHWTFGLVIDGIQKSNAASLTVPGVIASVLYGGIIEEVMLRLFFMSLIALIVWKIFFRSYTKETIPTQVFVIANVVAALLFAVGHLPATVALFGRLTPLILFRCFLLNGGFGLIFGWLYRKHGIAYAMLAHTLFHIVCKGILFIFA